MQQKQAMSGNAQPEPGSLYAAARAGLDTDHQQLATLLELDDGTACYCPGQHIHSAPVTVVDAPFPASIDHARQALRIGAHGDAD